MDSPVPFHFLTPRYHNPRILVSDDKMQITRLKYHNKRSDTTGSWIAYLNQPLSASPKLILQTAECTPHNKPPIISYVIGFTTCDPESIRKYKCHRTSTCKPDGRPCGGDSLTHAIRQVSDPDSLACFHRTASGSFKVTLKKKSFEIDDRTCVFAEAGSESVGGLPGYPPATPFLLLSGEVDSVRIVPESEFQCFQTPTDFVFEDDQKDLLPIGPSPKVIRVMAEISPPVVPQQQTKSKFRFAPALREHHLPEPAIRSVVDGYAFIVPGHDSELRKVVSKHGVASPEQMVFVNRPLDWNNKLVIKAERSLSAKAQTLAFGATGCDERERRSHECNPSSCAFISYKITYVPHFPREADFLVIERLLGDFIRISVHNTILNLKDTRNVFSGRQEKVYPFFQLSGSVELIRIVNENEIPKPLASVPKQPASVPKPKAKPKERPEKPAKLPNPPDNLFCPSFLNFSSSSSKEKRSNSEDEPRSRSCSTL